MDLEILKPEEGNPIVHHKLARGQGGQVHPATQVESYPC